jgi:hypothetical protein
MDIVAPSPTAQGDSAQPTSAASIQSLYTAQLQAVPELESYGPVLRSSNKPVALTESETEYVVTVVKHIYKEHIVFQVGRSVISIGSRNPLTLISTSSSTLPTRFRIPFWRTCLSS